MMLGQCRGAGKRRSYSQTALVFSPVARVILRDACLALTPSARTSPTACAVTCDVVLVRPWKACEQQCIRLCNDRVPR